MISTEKRPETSGGSAVSDARSKNPDHESVNSRERAILMTTVITMPTRPTPISEIELCAWVAQAAPGEALEYHRGFLGLDRSVMGRLMSYESRVKLDRTSDRAWLLAEQGLVHLVQRRLGPDSFSYIAIARPRPKNTPVSLTTLMPAEAA